MHTVRTRRAARGAVTTAIIALTIAALGVLARPGNAPTRAQSGPWTGSADVVIDYDDGRVAIHRIAFDEAPTGEALLRSAGVDAQLSSGAVCRIGGVGCPLSNCFCGPYWAYYWRGDDGKWAYATTGPAARGLKAGDVDAWVWRGARAPITATAQQRAVWLGARWLRAQQAPNGDYPSPGLAIEAILAARAAGVDPGEWTMGGRSVVRYLVDNLYDYSQPNASQAGKGLVGIAAAGLGVDEAGGFHPLANLARFYDPATGRYGPSTWEQSWAMLGVAAATHGLAPQASARSALIDGAAPNGGWSSMLGEAEAETDATGLAIQALVAAGEPVTSTAITRAVAFLDATQRDDGGFGHDGHHETTNANSTAYALQALYAAGESPVDARWASTDGKTPVDYLMRLQRPDGAVEFDAAHSGNALIATGQAIPALSGRSLDVEGTRIAADRAVAWLRDARGSDGAFAGGAANPGATIDAVLAVTAHGGWLDGPPSAGGATVADYLASVAADYVARGPSATGKLLAAIGALDADPRAFGGVDVLAAHDAQLDRDTAQFGTSVWDQAWSIRGAEAVGAPAPWATVWRLCKQAAVGGGWGFAAGADAADVDSTGLALSAIGAAYRGATASDSERFPGCEPAVRAGIAFLRRTQNATGGWPGYGPPDGASIDTTAAAVQGLVAVGQRVDRTGWYRPSPAHPLGLGPLDALVVQPSPSGAFPGFSGPDDVSATAAALRALVARVEEAPRARWTIHLPFASLPRR